MNQTYLCFAGVDWAREKHDACLQNSEGKVIGRTETMHSGEGLFKLAEWLVKTGGVAPEQIAIGIETPTGPVVEALLERGFAVFSINPKQLDRFRDRYSPAGAKDDQWDAEILADAVRTSRASSFRQVMPVAPAIKALREWTCIREDLVEERRRQCNRLQDQLWRYYPQVFTLNDDLTAAWVLDIVRLVPTPRLALRLKKAQVETILKRHRIRKHNADSVLEKLQVKPISVLPGTTEAARAHVELLIGQIQRLNSQIDKAEATLDTLIAEAGSSDPQEGEAGQQWQRDVTILKSFPGVGSTVVATLLAEASEPLRRRDYQALRCLGGVAPVTLKSGKSRRVIRRRAVNQHLNNALYYWSQTAAVYDARSRAKYTEMRQRGHNHARALRSIADRLLLVMCTMLTNGTEYDKTQQLPRPASRPAT